MRKIALTIALAIAASATSAQTSDGRIDRFSSMNDKQIAIEWEKLIAVTYGETEKDAIEHLKSHGMGENGAKTLAIFAKRAQLEMDDLFAQYPKDVCGKQDEVRESGGPEMLAQIIEESRRRIADARRRHLAEASASLSGEDQERLEHLFTTDHGPKVTIDDSKDAAVMIRTGQISVQQAITRTCKPENK